MRLCKETNQSSNDTIPGTQKKKKRKKRGKTVAIIPWREIKKVVLPITRGPMVVTVV